MRAASARSTETFPTKIDAWLVLLVSAGVIAAFAGAAAAWQADPAEAKFALWVIVSSWMLVAVLGLPCRYTLTEDELVVRSGIVRWRIPYAEITAIAPSREVWAAPVMSLQRVKITHGGGRSMSRTARC
jgi:membrane protein YdbS with pleckstrin-like domain